MDLFIWGFLDLHLHGLNLKLKHLVRKPDLIGHYALPVGAVCSRMLLLNIGPNIAHITSLYLFIWSKMRLLLYRKSPFAFW